MTTSLIGTCASPLGSLTIVVTQDAVLRALAFEEHGLTLRSRLETAGEALEPSAELAGMVHLMERYFAGHLDALDRVEVELRGTPFQRRVWTALRAIPAGTVISYAELAQRIAAPSAVRAVGGANHQNPVAIVVPCHRVIGKSGELIGYGGGLERKKWLLDHEQRYTGRAIGPLFDAARRDR